MQSRRDASIDVALARGTARSYRQHVELDLAVVGRKPMLDAGDDGEGRSVFPEMSRPDLGEGGKVLGVCEINLRMRHILEAGADKLQRRHDALRDDEFGLELYRLPAPLRALRHQCRRSNAVAARLVADRHAGDAGNEDEVADR